MRRLIQTIGTVAAVLVAGASTANAAPVVYDNGAPCGEGELYAITITWPQVVDSFKIAKGVNIGSAEAVIAVLDGAWDGYLEYFFFADNGGTPGALLASANAANVRITATGIPDRCPSRPFSVLFDLQTPFVAAADVQYFFGIHAAADYVQRVDDIAWISSVGGDTVGAFARVGGQGDWGAPYGELAFNLRKSTEVPEPGTLAILGLSLAGLVAQRKRRQ